MDLPLFTSHMTIINVNLGIHDFKRIGDDKPPEESWRCRELVKPLRKKVGGVEATGKPSE